MNRWPKAEKFASGRLLRGAMLVQQEAGGRAGKPRAASARRPHNKAFSRTGGEEEGIQARRNLTVFLFFSLPGEWADHEISSSQNHYKWAFLSIKSWWPNWYFCRRQQIKEKEEADKLALEEAVEGDEDKTVTSLFLYNNKGNW